MKGKSFGVRPTTISMGLCYYSLGGLGRTKPLCKQTQVEVAPNLVSKRSQWLLILGCLIQAPRRRRRFRLSASGTIYVRTSACPHASRIIPGPDWSRLTRPRLGTLCFQVVLLFPMSQTPSSVIKASAPDSAPMSFPLIRSSSFSF